MRGMINGKDFEAALFGFDGCHKIYLCDTPEGQRQLETLGYELLPVEELPAVWASTCPLRFILSGDLSKVYVGQCEPARFEGWGLSDSLQADLSEMEIEQSQANAGR